MTQPELLDVGIHGIETVEPGAEAPASPTPKPETSEFLASVQATEITEPAANLNSTERAVIITQPELLNVGIQREETVEPEAKAPASPTQKTERIESLTLTDVSEVGGQEEAAVETAKSINHTQRDEIQMEIGLTEVNVQLKEITEPATHQAVIKAQPVLLDVAVHGIETVEPEAQAPASPTPEAERIESLTLTVVSEVGGQAVEAVESAEPINPTKRAESKTQIDLTEVNDLPPEITEPTAPLDSTEGAVIMTQPELLDIGIHGIETVEPGAEAPASPTPKPETSEFLASVQATEITEPAANLNSTERAVIITQPELLNVGIQRIETVEPEAKAPASPTQKTERIESLTLTDVSEVGGQEEAAVETAKSINQIGLTEVNVQPKEITEPATHQAVIKAQPVLLDVAVHGIETVEPVAKAPASQTPEAERIESLTLTDVSEVGGQAVESIKPINPTQRAESQTDLAVIYVQATEITEPGANLDSTKRALITTQPVLLDDGIQETEIVEPGEQIKSTVRVTSSVQATETIQPLSETEDREVLLAPPAQSEACEETKAEEHVNNTEEENDQDVWMDAEEVIYAQAETEVSFLEVEEPLEPQAESAQEEKAGLEVEVEIAPHSKTEEEESQEEVYKTGETGEIESEGEDFAIALEHQEYATLSIATMEWN
uniref:cytadherence high molecular weight protein 1-like n=1 Tax=Semicossyphus pulcher TaxID=241346 RepID=UPI0037E79FCC